jgi:hypothetical protein
MFLPSNSEQSCRAFGVNGTPSLRRPDFCYEGPEAGCSIPEPLPSSPAAG